MSDVKVILFFTEAYIDFNKTLCECPICLKKRRAEWKNDISSPKTIIIKKNTLNSIINYRK